MRALDVTSTRSVRGGLSDSESAADASLHSAPVLLTQTTDYCEFRPADSQNVCTEPGRRAKPCGMPIRKKVIRGRCAWRRFRREDADEHIRSFFKIRAARDDHRRTDLCFYGSRQHPDNDVSCLQCSSSDSSASSRRMDAAVNSLRSSSDQESDQSTLAFGWREAKRSASAVNSAAASGGRRRNASTRDASRALNCNSIAHLQYTAVSLESRTQSRPVSATSHPHLRVI